MTSHAEIAARYERYALIFDPDHSRLGSEALGLVERGIDPLYAGDADEAHLLALQEAGRVGALVVPGTLPLAMVDLLIDRISPHLWAGPAAIVAVAPPDDRGLLRALRDRGLSWVLREPYDATEFRFVVSAALATEDKLEPRSGLRVPISLPATVTLDGQDHACFTRNLSVGGAYLALPAPFAPGAQIRVAIGLGDRSLELEATVVYCQAQGATGRAERESGMGVAFRAPADTTRGALTEFIEERVASFRL